MACNPPLLLLLIRFGVFSRKKMYGHFAGTKKTGRNDEVTVVMGWNVLNRTGTSDDDWRTRGIAWTLC